MGNFLLIFKAQDQKNSQPNAPLHTKTSVPSHQLQDDLTHEDDTTTLKPIPPPIGSFHPETVPMDTKKHKSMVQVVKIFVHTMDAFLLRQHLTCADYGIYVATLKFACTSMLDKPLPFPKDGPPHRLQWHLNVTNDKQLYVFVLLKP